MSIDSIKHTQTSQRSHTPSREEAGIAPDSQARKADYPLNPVATRGQDPELFWMHKYGPEDREDRLRVDIRNLYRTEHIAPEKLIQQLYRIREEGPESPQLSFNELFGNALEYEEPDKPASYYTHADGRTNRLIQGDSLVVMTSLLERKGMVGKVQMIYLDPPYGIKFGSNWQMKLGERNVKDGDDKALSGEPEVIKAYRDTWELGIHFYLSYLRDRLLVARDLLTESGSCFVQISDENVHLVRCVMDEVFGSGNFVNLISVQKTTSSTNRSLSGVADYLLCYGKNYETTKYRPLFKPKTTGGEGAAHYQMVELPGGTRRGLAAEEKSGLSLRYPLKYIP